MATDVTNVPDLDLQFFGNDGKPLASGYLKFFRSGTDVPASVYTSDGETALGPSIQLDASGFPVVQFSLKTGQLYTVKAFNSDNVLVWTRNDISGSSEGGGAGNWVPIEGTSLADPILGPLVIKYDDKTTELTNEHLSSDTAMQVVAPEVLLAANDGAAVIIGTPRVAINAVGSDSAQIYIQSDKKIEMQGTQIEIKAPNSGNEITINSKGLTEIIGGATLVQGNNGLSLYGGGTGITLNGAANFLSTATLNNKTVNDIWTSTSTGVMDDTQLITAKAAYDMAQGGGGGVSPSFCEPFGNLLDGHFSLDVGASGTLGWFGRTPLRNVTIKSILVGTFGVDLLDTAEIGIYAMRSNRALTLIAKQSVHSITSDGSVLFELQTPVSVGNEIIFIGGLFSQTNTWSSNRVIFLNTNANSPLLLAMNDTSTIYKDMTKYPVMAYPFNALPVAATENIVSRRGFYWPDFSLSTLPASTTSSDWHTTGSVLFLPYVAVEIS